MIFWSHIITMRSCVTGGGIGHHFSKNGIGMGWLIDTREVNSNRFFFIISLRRNRDGQHS